MPGSAKGRCFVFVPFTIPFTSAAKAGEAPSVQPTTRLQPQAGFAPDQQQFAMLVEMCMPSWDSARTRLMLGVLAKPTQPRRGSRHQSKPCIPPVS